jgi:hypothetical protein
MDDWFKCRYFVGGEFFDKALKSGIYKDEA